MDGFASLWSCQEENMEMKEKLLSLSMELETLRSNTTREIRKKEKLIDELVHLLRTTMQERDEARVYLQLLQSYYQPGSPAMNQIGNCYSQNCSPEKSSVVNLASPSLMSMGDCGGGIALQQPAVDVFDQLAAKKPLAERGKLLQAVLEAGPLLESIMAAGPLPRWHNLSLQRPMQVPPVATRGGADQTLSYEPRTFGCMN